MTGTETLDPILVRLRQCWQQLHGPTGHMHRTAILAAIDRHLDAWLNNPPLLDDRIEAP